MEALAAHTRHLVIGTATPIQTERTEVWDLLKLLAIGNDFVLGRKGVSAWYQVQQALDLVTGEHVISDPYEAWHWLRTPLPISAEGSLFDMIRDDLDIRDGSVAFTTDSVSQLTGWTQDELELALQDGTHSKGRPFFRYHNPLSRHVVLRRRRTLEDAGLMPKISVNIHPNESSNRVLFDGDANALNTPHFYDEVYQLVEAYTKAMAEEKSAGAGWIKNLMLQRVCSSLTAGLNTARAMLESRARAMTLMPELGLESETGDEEMDAALEALRANPDLMRALDAQADTLGAIVDHIEAIQRRDANLQSDPKAQAVIHFLSPASDGGPGWASRGCIMFSQYYDTSRWMAERISHLFPEDLVAVYAGMGKSGVLVNGEWTSVDRENIKAAVKDHKIKLVCATDAACEGLNLQTLGTLINIDLPWNPSRLEQRIGRIKRFGQRLSCVEMANLVYADTVDATVYARVSERLKGANEVLGSIPDTIKDDWIDDVKDVLDSWESRSDPESCADVFELRYGDFLEQEDDWERCEQVLAKEELLRRLTTGW